MLKNQTTKSGMIVAKGFTEINHLKRKSGESKKRHLNGAEICMIFVSVHKLKNQKFILILNII